MAKDPAVLWYWNDWSGGTITLSRHLKGCYMDLLHAQFNNGSLSLDEIKTVLGSDFGSTWPALQKKFKQDDKGLFFNERLVFEKSKRENFSEKQKNKRLGKTKSKPNGNQNETYIENENEIIDESIKIQKVQEKFSEILNSEKWLQEVSMQNRITAETCKGWLTEFLIEQKLKDEIHHRTIKEIKKHFISWLKIQIEKRNKQNGKSTTNFDELTTRYESLKTD